MNQTLKMNLRHIGLFIIIIWGTFFVSRLLPLNAFGIRPRTAFGLLGVLFSPFLHGSLEHISSNTMALLVFTPLFSLVEGSKSLQKIGLLIIMSGIITWIIGRPSIHIGASGLIFALYGYLVSLGFFKKKFILMILSIGLTVVYGYMIFGVLPGKAGISWEGHLAGFISGVVLAKYY